MPVYKRVEISVETDRVLIIRRCRVLRVWCQECGHEVDMVDISEAGTLAAMSEPVLRDCAAARRWHVYEGQDGIGLVCLESLLKSV